MITEAQYMGEWRFKPESTALVLRNVQNLLACVNGLMASAKSQGIVFKNNPATFSQISGDQFGGFRPIGCPIGATNSAHKTGQAVDLFDPMGEIDAWCLKNAEEGGLLQLHCIYIESPDFTPHWSHWSTRKPPSGNRVFRP